ncbi:PLASMODESMATA CALLOSE-BINDING PROTEIN 3-like isoform X1 [Phalaenopsis equestris]|uniref:PLASMODESMATA CALLOSE-BINDING PROTEIN 3-like isoform X1 n=1 Tax=Phalaenopsis equestris TaxID=78828 RepID=UPI0009E24286|nr:PLASMODESMATA CALLOSE-BINDING PROTEIN 3-like isoform X1 [Phalaenopsis equestris]
MSSHRAIPSLFAFPSLSTLLLSMDCHSTSPSAAAAIFFLFAATIARAGEAAQWCIARSDASSTALQTALDYACGPGMADCLPIQPNGLCYLPNSLPAHASYAFNSFYQRSGSCDFAGVATVSITDPSYGSCTYPSSTRTAGGSTTPNSNTPSTSSPTGPGFGDTDSGGGGGGLTPGLGTPLSDNSGAESISIYHLLYTYCCFLLLLP